MGLRAVTLGHAHPAVIEAAAAAMRLGSNFTRPHPLEVECAERLLAWRAEHLDQSLALSALTERGVEGEPAALPLM